MTNKDDLPILDNSLTARIARDRLTIDNLTLACKLIDAEYDKQALKLQKAKIDCINITCALFNATKKQNKLLSELEQQITSLKPLNKPLNPF